MLEIFMILALVVLVYYPTWGYHMVIDDVRRRDLVQASNSILIGNNLLDTFLRRFYGMGTLCRVKAGGGHKVNIRAEHILSTVIHAINTVLVYVVFGMTDVAFGAAVLYAVHPAGLQTSVWLNGRRYAMAVMMMLVMICCVKYGGDFGVLGLVLYPVAVLLQPVAFLSAMVYGWVGVGVVCVLAGVMYPMYRQKINERLEKIHSTDMRDFSLKKLIPIVKIYGYSMLKMILPGRLMMCDRNLFYWGMTEDGNKDAYSIKKDFVIGIVLVLGSVIALFFIPDVGNKWYWVLMCLSTLQWCGFITAVQHSADRYLAVPLVFAMYFLVTGINDVFGSYWLHVVIALATYYVFNLKTSLGMYKDMESFWNYHFYYDPGGPKCREFKATFQIKTGDKFGAWETVREGLRYNPTDFKLNLLAANCCFLLGDQNSMINYLKEAKKTCYIGNEFIYKDACKNIFGVDLEAEVTCMNMGLSKRSAKERENIKMIHEMVMV